MPKQTLEKQQEEYIEDASQLFMAAELMEDSSNVSFHPEFDDFNEDILADRSGLDDFSNEDAVMMLRALGMGWMDVAIAFKQEGSRGPYFRVQKSKDFFELALKLPDRDFRAVFRIGRKTFDIFVEILQQNTIFVSQGRKPQRHVRWQLACFLIRYGQLGSPVHDTMLKMGIGYGTVILYCRRVIRAFRELRGQFAAWPNDTEQQESIDSILMNVGFPNCVGSCDGSLVQTYQPSQMGAAYLSQKGFFAYAIQAVVNHGIWFAAWDLGWPGSVTDSRIFKNSHFWIHRNQYLKNGRYILVDKGYPSTPYSVRPFSAGELGKATSPILKHRMKDFNYKLSKQRITVEHAFGCLKLRFRSLQMMGVHENVQDAWRAIDSLMILHNMCLYYDDQPAQLDDYSEDIHDDGIGDWDGDILPEMTQNNVGGPADIPHSERAASLRVEGYRLRNELMDIVCPAAEYQQ